jgi:hypothetical protein
VISSSERSREPSFGFLPSHLLRGANQNPSMEKSSGEI